jgi:CubicO group peptidase (beta-lactamase class C family)
MSTSLAHDPSRRARPIALLLAAVACAAGAPSHALAEDPDALLRERLADVGGRGAIILAEIERGAAPRYRSVGTSGDPARPAVDEHTVFEIGSITKTITAFLLAEAVARGEVALDDTLAARLPARVGKGAAGAISLGELATHTSGLPRVPADARFFRSLLLRPRDPYRGYREADLDRYLATWQRPAKRSFSYSNVGFSLLGEALSRAAGQPYADLVRDRFAAPLGLRSTWIEVPAAERGRIALGHDQNGDRAPSWTLGTSIPAGGVRSTAHDLAVYLTAARDGSLPHAATLFTARAETSVAGRGIGLGWLVDRRHGADLVWHDGGMGGYRSFVGLNRRTGRGVVLLASAEREVTDLGLHLLDPAFPLWPTERPLALVLFGALGPLFLAAVATVRRRRRGVPATRLDVLGRVLAAFFTLAVCWHLTPWGAIGGRPARGVVAAGVVTLALVALARARSLAWFGAEGRARRALQMAGLAVSAAVLAFALARF